MKKNTLVGLGLFFLGSFSLIVGALRFPSVEFYTGGIVIALFVAGLFYSWGNAIRQAKEIDQSTKTIAKGPATENAQASQQAATG